MATIPAPDPAPADIARAIASALVRLGWSQGKLARRVGVSRHTIAAVLTGDGNPRLSTLCAVAGALGTTLAVLASGRPQDIPRRLLPAP